MSDLNKRKGQVSKSNILGDKVKDDYLSKLEERLRQKQDKKEKEMRNNLKSLLLEREKLIIQLRY
ncbi:hypothetical protein FGF1_03880 [Flavobacteriaceae bacterium GF1]